MKFERGALVSPTAASTYYGAAITHSSSFAGVSGFEGRPPEIIELARALNNDPDQIFEFVRNHIDVEYSYGLRKGALGALIDRSGTPFDQNVLFVELVRQAGYTARYKFGTATFTSAQFQDWTGLANGIAACQMLAFNGVPAAINGSSPSNCAVSSTISSVQIAHIWSEVDIGGTTYVFDPSFKSHAMVAQRNLITGAGLVGGAASTQAAGGVVTGTDSGQTYIRDINDTNLDAYLTARSTALLNDLKANAFSADMREVVGGRLIVPAYEPTNANGDPIGFRATTTPYTSSASVTITGDIPDQYRTGLLVATSNNGFGNISRQLWVDEIYGRRLEFDTNFDAAHIDSPDDYYDVALRLELDDVTLNEVSHNCPTPNWSAGCHLPGFTYNISLTVNHPFAASSGAYADAVISGVSPGSVPVAIMHGWGRVSSELGTKWGRERKEDEALPNKVAGGYNCDPEWLCTSNYQSPAGDMNRQQMGAAWLAQVSRMLSLQGEIGQSEIEQLHNVGLVGWQYRVDATDPSPENPNDGFDYSISDQIVVVNMVTSLAVASRGNDEPRARAVSRAIAVSAAMLEGSVVEQMQDLPDGASTASRFGWGNRPDTEDPCAAGRRKFYDFTGSSSATMLSLVQFEGTTTGCSTSPPILDSQKSITRSNYRDLMQAYLAQGYQISGSAESFLGPGGRIGAMSAYTTSDIINCSAPACSYYAPSLQRGGAFVASKYDGNGNVLEVAHILGGLGAKGGGGSSPSQSANTFDPRKAADVLKDRFVDRSSALGVDLKTGSVGYTTPSLLSAGAGEAAPYRLDYKLKFQAGPDACSPQFGPCTAPITGGWTHNWDIKLSVSGSGLEAMGATSPMAGTDAIVAIWAMQDIFLQAGDSNLRKDVYATLAGDWWRRRMVGNVVTINRSFAAQQFVRQADNTWHAPVGAPGTLTQTGVRTKVRDLCFPGSVVPTLPSTARRWDASAVSFKLRDAGGDELNFSPWTSTYGVDGCSKLYGFKITTWTSPGRPTLTFATDSTGIVTSVQSSIGYTLSVNSGGSITTSAGTRTASFGGATVTDASGAARTFQFVAAVPRSAAQRPQPYQKLLRVYEPHAPSSAALEYTYDALGRVKEAKDGRALQGAYGAYEFFIAEGARGQRLDPAGGRYTVYFDSEGDAVRHIDEIGRMTTSFYDGRHRATRRTYPEGDYDSFVYDGKDNVTNVVKTAKPGSGLADITVSATWDPTWNQVATLTDAKGAVTSFTYHASGNGAGQLATANRPQVKTPVGAQSASPSVGLATPTYTFTYNAIGLVLNEIDPEGRTTTHAYDAAGNRTSTTVGAAAINGYTTAGIPAYPALNLATTFTPDAWGNVVTVTDPRGNATSSIYDAMRRPVLVTMPDPDGAGPQIAPQKVTKYDASGQPNFEANRDTGNQWQGVVTERDVLGRPVKVTRPKSLSLGSVTTLAQVQALALQTVGGSDDYVMTTYDSVGRTDIVTDPQGRAIKTLYDAAGQVTQVKRGFGSSDQQDYQTNVWTKNGKLLSVTNSKSATTTYSYDGFDRSKRVYYPNCTASEINASPASSVATGGAEPVGCLFSEVTTYDANSNPTQTRNRANQVFTLSYDVLNRVTKKATPDREETYSYELGGLQVCSEVWSAGAGAATCLTGAPASRVATAYDAAGRLRQEGQRINGNTYTVGYGYDAASNRTHIIWPDNWRAVYGFDALNRLNSVAYDADGNGATDGTLALYANNALSQITGVRRGTATWGSGVTASDLTWEADGDLDTLLHTLNGESASFTFDYDKSGKLLSDTKSAAYAYAPPSAATVSYSTGSAGSSTDRLDQYATVAGQTPTYDANGNRLTLAGLTTTHDAENRLTAASKTGMSVAYLYDASGRRTMKDFSTGGTDIIYLSAGDMEIADYNGTTLLRRYVPGVRVDDRAAMIEANGAISYYHADRIGNVVAVTNSTGVATDRYKYTPFGIEVPLATSGNEYRYTGRRYDQETGLYHYRARYYNPSEAGGGRFLEIDPIGYKDQMNLYGYVGNDPVNRMDPDGNKTVEIGGEINLVPIVGFKVGLGIAVSFPTSDDPEATFDMGITATLGGRVGAEGGAGIVGSIENGSVADQGSIKGVASGHVGPVSGEAGVDIVRSKPDGGGSLEVATYKKGLSLTPDGAKIGGKAGLGIGGSAGIDMKGTLSPGSIFRALGIKPEPPGPMKNQDPNFNGCRPGSGDACRR